MRTVRYLFVATACAVLLAVAPSQAAAADPVAAVKDVAVRFIQNTKTAQLNGKLTLTLNGGFLASVAVDSKFDFTNKRNPLMQYTITRVGIGRGPITVTLRDRETKQVEFLKAGGVKSQPSGGDHTWNGDTESSE